MHFAILAALIPPAIYATVNYIDQYLIHRYFKGGGVGALMIFSSLIGAFAASTIYLFQPNVLQTPMAVGMQIMLNGAIYIIAALPYFHAIQQDEVSRVVPLFQLTPVFAFIMEWLIFGNRMNVYQISAGIVIIICSFLISLDINQDSYVHLKLKTLLLMSMSSFFYAVNTLLFKAFATNTPFWTTSFYEYLGFACVALFLFLIIRSYRVEFLRVLHENKGHILLINGVNEIINIVGKITFNAVSLVMPVTIVWIFAGFQPIFVLLYGVLLTFLFPKLIQENITKKVLIQKAISIGAMFIASIVLTAV